LNLAKRIIKKYSFLSCLSAEQTGALHNSGIQSKSEGGGWGGATSGASLVERDSPGGRSSSSPWEHSAAAIARGDGVTATAALESGRGLYPSISTSSSMDGGGMCIRERDETGLIGMSMEARTVGIACIFIGEEAICGIGRPKACSRRDGRGPSKWSSTTRFKLMIFPRGLTFASEGDGSAIAKQEYPGENQHDIVRNWCPFSCDLLHHAPRGVCVSCEALKEHPRN